MLHVNFFSGVILFLFFSVFSFSVAAAGVVPEEILLNIDEKNMGGQINVKNTEPFPVLLYTRVVDLPEEDRSVKLLVTQPVIRVEAGQVQQVRFILQTRGELKREHLKRVMFEGIPPADQTGNYLTINIQQDIPVIIQPRSVPVNPTAWKLLKWSIKNRQLSVENPTRNIIRLNPGVILQPSSYKASLPKTYILPGEKIFVNLQRDIKGDQQVKFVPGGRYGVDVDSWTAQLVN
ncbi:fimbria/pilus chaperone family protein [Entomohabitans teleogrylli]|uniref:fimbria/pilus chaperone family protein n=1 Tax=Entomohabitans teleogrylli TaxID=1384589 RepID=UPI00073DA665|nr:fimbria/pilus chaperone family protein [Entomohabitans teleogrylli]